MSADARLSFDELMQRIVVIFRRCGVSEDSAESVARVMTAAERDQCKSHGIYRIEGCLRALAAGKVVPDAVPEVVDAGRAVIEVDAGGGFASPAIDVALDSLEQRARELGMAALVIRDCLHFSALWHDVELLAERGLAALSMCPSYAVVTPVGGRAPLLGTNPLAFGWPRPGQHPYVFDFATSMAARGEIELHRRAGTALPEGWAVDVNGAPTTDPEAALQGAMLPFGGHKGSAISTMIELLSGAMLGEFMSVESLGFMGGTDRLARHGALIIALDPAVFAARSGRDPIAEGERLISAITGQGARLPSQRRYAARAESLSNGIVLTAAEIAQLELFERVGLKAIRSSA